MTAEFYPEYETAVRRYMTNLGLGYELAKVQPVCLGDAKVMLFKSPGLVDIHIASNGREQRISLASAEGAAALAACRYKHAMRVMLSDRISEVA